MLRAWLQWYYGREEHCYSFVLLGDKLPWPKWYPPSCWCWWVSWSPSTTQVSSGMWENMLLSLAQKVTFWDCSFKTKQISKQPWADLFWSCQGHIKLCPQMFLVGFASWSPILSRDHLFLWKHEYWVMIFPRFSTVFLRANLLTLVDISTIYCLLKSKDHHSDWSKSAEISVGTIQRSWC